MLDDASGTLQYQVFYPQDTNERITDLAFTTTSLVTVSDIRTNDYKYVIRNSNLALLTNVQDPMYVSYLNTRYEVPTSSLNTVVIPRPSSPARVLSHDIRIIEIPNTEKVIVAYEGHGGEFTNDCGVDTINTNLHRLALTVVTSTPSVLPVMENAQIASKDIAYKYGFIGIKYLTSTSSVALLHKNTIDPNGIAGMIQYPSLTTFGHQSSQLTGECVFSSMDVSGTHELNLIGMSVTDYHLIHFTQDLSQMSPTCYPVLPQCYNEKMSTTEAVSVASPMTSYPGSEPWNVRNFGKEELENILSCKSY